MQRRRRPQTHTRRTQAPRARASKHAFNYVDVESTSRRRRGTVMVGSICIYICFYVSRIAEAAVRRPESILYFHACTLHRRSVVAFALLTTFCDLVQICTRHREREEKPWRCGWYLRWLAPHSQFVLCRKWQRRNGSVRR